MNAGFTAASAAHFITGGSIMRRSLGIISIVLFAAVVFCIISSPAQAQMKLRLSTMWPPTHPHSVLFNQWGKDVETGNAGKGNGNCICSEHTFTSDAGL